MAESELRPVLRHVRALAGPPVTTTLTDAQLLRSFTSHHDEAAFAELVQRHGPLVLSVCRRLLRQEQDAEDAFQATFLVLARKAASIRQGQSLASWLYGVAHRTGLRLRTAAARRPIPGMQSPMRQPDPPTEASLRELQMLLDEEVSRLPEKYRAPFVLCCLEGHSRAEAAQQLGWNEGTLSGRLALARQQLRQRLARRGVSLTAVLTAVALGPGVNASVPVALLGVIVETAMRFATDQQVGAFSVQVIALAEAVLRAMSRTRINIAALSLLFLTLAGAGAGMYAFGEMGEKPGQGTRPRAESPPAPAPDRLRVDRSGDPLPSGAISRLGTIRFRTWADKVAFLKGDKVLATIGREAVSFWDVGTGKATRRTVSMHWGEASALSSDGKLLAVSAVPNDSTIHLWEVDTGKELRQFKGFRGRTRAMVFATDGRTLVSGGLDNKVRVWEVDTGKEIRTIEVGHPVEGLAISADGKIFASAGWDVASTVSVRETGTGKELHRYRLPLGVRHVAFSPDGKALAALEDWNDDGGVRENKVHLWDVSTGKLRRQLVVREHILCLAFSPDSKALATGHLDTFHVWNLNTGKWLPRFEGQSRRADIMTFSGDGKSLAIGGDSTLRLWDVVTGKEVLPPGDGHRGAVQALAFLPDGKTLVTGGADHTLRHWEAATGKEVRRFSGIGGSSCRSSFAVPGVLAVPTQQEVRLCDPTTGKELRRFRFPAYVRQVVLTPDGKTLAAFTGGDDQSVRFVDTDTGKERLARRYQDFVQAMALSPDGEFLALGPVNPVLRLLDTATGNEVYQLRLQENVTSMAFSPDGKTLAGGAGCGTLHFWEVATGKERARLPDRDLRSGSTMIFSPDGRLLALGDSDGTLRLRQVGTGKEVRRLTGHQNGITCLAFSADGKMLASGSWDTTVLVWDVSALLDRRREQTRELEFRRLEALWTDLASDDAVAAYQAIQKLAAAPQQTVSLLKAHLLPVATVDPKRLGSLLADLDSDAFGLREKATAELEKLGESAGLAMRKALKARPSLEARRRLERLLYKLRRVSPAPERLRELRALEVLEQIDSADTRQILGALAAGMPEARLTQEAKAVLRRRIARSGAR